MVPNKYSSLSIHRKYVSSTFQVRWVIFWVGVGRSIFHTKPQGRFWALQNHHLWLELKHKFYPSTKEKDQHYQKDQHWDKAPQSLVHNMEAWVQFWTHLSTKYINTSNGLAIFLSPIKWFFIQISIIHDTISSHICLDAKHTKVCFNYWHLDELKVSQDDNICKLIHRIVSLKKLPQWFKMPYDTK